MSGLAPLRGEARVGFAIYGFSFIAGTLTQVFWLFLGWAASPVLSIFGFLLALCLSVFLDGLGLAFLLGAALVERTPESRSQYDLCAAFLSAQVLRLPLRRLPPLQFDPT